MAKKKKILFVDDDPIILEAYRAYFEAKGYNVKTASDGFECACTLSDFNPDFIVLDLVMPNVEGMKVAEFLSQSKKFTTRIIVISAYIEPDIQKRLNQLGIQFLEKPIEGSDLESFLTTL